MLDDIIRQIDILRASLRTLCKKVPAGPEQSRQAITLLNEAHRHIRLMIRGKQFESLSDEIRYFRHLKPSLTSRIIYHQKVYHLEITKPFGPEEQLVKHYSRELDKMAAFYTDNAEFIRYIRSGDTMLDNIYFIRDTLDFRRIPETVFSELDPEQTTHYDIKVAKYFAYEELAGYIRTKLDGVKSPTQLPEPPPVPEHREERDTRWLKSHQVERMLGISQSTLRKLRNQGEIPFRKIGGIYFYSEEEILRVLRHRNKNL